MSKAAFALSVLVLACASWGAIVYEPVQYEFRDPYHDHPTFYYGGTNPMVFAHGRNLQMRYNQGLNPTLDIAPSFALEGRPGFNLLYHGVINTPAAYTYSDLLPVGVIAYPYGMSVSDVRNEAYSNVPRYFRKSDLLRTAHREHDGTWVVPAQTPHGMIHITPAHHGPTTQPASQPSSQPILIIPKRLLNKPLQDKSNPVASAAE